MNVMVDWRAIVSRRWFRVLYGLGILLLIAAIAYFGHPWQRFLLLASLLFPAAAGASILLRWPALGVLALIPVSLNVRFAIGTGTETQVHAGILLLGLLLGLWLLNIAGRQSEFRLVSARPVYPLFGLLVVAVLAFISGQLSWFMTTPAPLLAQLGGLGLFVLSAGAFLLPTQQIRELKWLRWTTWLFLAIASLYVAGQLFRSYFLFRLFPFGAGGSLLWLWLAALGYGQAIANRKLHPAWRIGLLLLVAASLYVTYFILGSWKSAWVPALIAIGTITLLRKPALGALLALAALVIAPTLVTGLIDGDQYSFETRVEAWQILGQIIKVNPVLGLGPANYYFYTPLYTIRGYFSHFNSHNQYVDLVAQTGVLGLFLYLWFFWEVGRLGWKLRAHAPSGFAQAYIYGALGGLVGTLAAGMLGDWVLPFVYNVGFSGFRSSILSWLFLGGLVALQQIVFARDGSIASQVPLRGPGQG